MRKPNTHNFWYSSAGLICRDVLKFMGIYLIMLLIILGLNLLYIQLVFHQYMIDVSDVFAPLPDLDMEQTEREVMKIAELSRFIPFLLAVCAVFVSIPPKPLKHVAITGVIVLTILAPISFSQPMTTIILEALGCILCMVMAWGASQLLLKKH